MTMELKCCPFCGGEAESDSQRGYRNISTGNPENAAAIYCTKCNADMTWCYRDTPEIERDQVMTLLIEQWNTRATASLQCEDAVERVARISHAEVDKIVSDLMSANYSDKPRLAVAVGRAIVKANERGLATGLVPNESAIRADERERCAKVAEAEYADKNWHAMYRHAAGAIAAAIRSGGGE